tara:strand:+ start:1797 stop:4034 length:2238 start_codon:yes stop_codon:yes gene_type:complete
MLILVIVESPNKCSKIEKYLNDYSKKTKSKDTYKVIASKGHFRDLPLKELGVSEYPEFKPTYTITNAQSVSLMRNHNKKADKVVIATDADREGEGIGYHIAELLKLKNPDRIIFREITYNAIVEAIQKPEQLCVPMIEAYQARRIIDRLIGYQISPLLWDKWGSTSSAGRTQSIVLHFITEKQKEINEYVPDSVFSTYGTFENDMDGKASKVFKKKEDLEEWLTEIAPCKYSVDNVQVKPSYNSAPLPFQTSSLQQFANSYGFNLKSTQSVSQSLYEKGFITYIRTDSTVISKVAIEGIRDTITNLVGKNYIGNPKQRKSKKKVADQEAHEAIRPTDMNKDYSNLNKEEQKLYLIIWRRTMASQMINEEFENATLKLVPDKKNLGYFTVSTKWQTKPGWTITKHMFPNQEYNVIDNEIVKPEWLNLDSGTKIKRKKLVTNEEHSNPPAYYNEASIVRDLEKKGIGRPSTYVNSYQVNIYKEMIKKTNMKYKGQDYLTYTVKANENDFTIKKNPSKEKTFRNVLVPTDKGIEIDEYLQDKFSELFREQYTIEMEEQLDKVSTSDMKSIDILKELHLLMDPLLKKHKKVKHKPQVLGEYKGQEVTLKNGKFGFFLQYGDQKVGAKSIKSNPTLEDAIEFLEKKGDVVMGNHKGGDVVFKSGRYGNYLQYKGKNYPAKFLKADSLFEDAIKYLEKDKMVVAKGKKCYIKNGQYGWYFNCEGKNYKIGQDYNAEKLTSNDCIEIMNKKK